MKVAWREVNLSDFGTPEEVPLIPKSIYEKRCRALYDQSGCHWVVVYGDREHFANLTYLTAFDPRFEEAVLLLGPKDRRVLIVGNEGMGYTSHISLDLDVVLCQTFSLMGQDRSLAPRLSDVLHQAGMNAGQRVGLIGWKYLEPEEWTAKTPGVFAPAMLVDLLREISGDPGAVVDATHLLMHPSHGLRCVNEVEQIAALEWGAARATRDVYRILRRVQPGISEHEAVASMGYAGEPLTAHVMFASSHGEIVGLRSPMARRIERGDGATTAIGYWGGLCARAGLVDESNSEFVSQIAGPYFKGLVTWYETMRLGVSGGTIFEKVVESLAQGNLRSMLNPGHLTSLEEWVHSPVRPGSLEPILSGMAFQSDIIPIPMPPGRTVNCEDPLVLADEPLRAELARRFPEVWSRIRARQEFMRCELGIGIGDEILPLSTIPAYFPPLWLSPTRVIVIE